MLRATAEAPAPQFSAPLEPAETDDAELVELFRQGDAGAFTELYSRHWQRVLRAVTPICGSASLAEDIVQETFMRAAAAAGRYQNLRFGPWLVRIARNLAIDQLRIRSRLRLEPLEDLWAGLPERHSSSVESELLRREQHTRVAEVLERLTPRHRRVLVLREVDGLSYTAIATELGVSYGAVETLLFRARRRFREEYARAVETEAA